MNPKKFIILILLGTILILLPIASVNYHVDPYSIIRKNEVFYNLLEGIDLAEYFITSKAEKTKGESKEELKIEVVKTTGTKCPRCWKILQEKCDRCEKAVIE